MSQNQNKDEVEIAHKNQRRKYSLAANFTILGLISIGTISKHVEGLKGLYTAMPLVALIAFIVFMYLMKKSLTCSICGGGMKIDGKTCAKCGHCFES